ncbi:uncharacterized protein SPPG_07324 [Spizellomyces punctatus DAOM BR117]|uniref:Uncharacterized protein n=1 Tax=Spizellomyces punctatus (strain DAOM BR117) TaxID=645134 RepID=A0A0L0H839_SPIPD|nr:uncharacterized protein SPPG_07324 [Spizellomyces punctatus DAOM BR117]KNC97397.1 hypothetical protein SPPG_07324 [Spizellomyces punctatus DAOM BR117]|eukprot:XP_016605437.1 hypothetical protein SPPG_07324 [Spizellomyces punctatus DAOM BR117]
MVAEERPPTAGAKMRALGERDKLHEDLAALVREQEEMEVEIRAVEKEEDETKQKLVAVMAEMGVFAKPGREGEEWKVLYDRMRELWGVQSEVEARKKELQRRRKVVEDKLTEVYQQIRKRLRSQIRAQARIATRAVTSLRLHREMGALRTCPSPVRDEAALAAEGVLAPCKSPGETAGDGSSS